MNTGAHPFQSFIERFRKNSNHEERWPIFISYRRGDLTRKIALWLKGELESEKIQTTTGEVFSLKVFVDIAESHQTDFQAHLEPYLKHSRALILLADEAASSKRTQARDYLFEELDWWADRRKKTPPIVLQLDAVSAGNLLSDSKYAKWRKVNFIDCFWESWARESDGGKAERDRLLVTLRESIRNYGQTVHLDEVLRLKRRAFIAAVFAIAALVAACVAGWQSFNANKNAATADENLNHSDFEAALRFIDQGDDNRALTYLAKVYRKDPKNPVVPALLYNTLMRQVAWPLPLATPIDFGEPVQIARFSSSGNRFLVVHAPGLFKPGTLQVFDTDSFLPVGKTILPGDDIATACFSPDGRRILTTSSSIPPRLWDAETGSAVGPPLASSAVAYGLECACFSRDGSRVFTLASSIGPSAMINNTLSTWDAGTGNLCPPEATVDFGNASGRCINSDGQLIAVVTLDNVAQIWDVREKQFIGDPVPMGSPVQLAEFDPNGKSLLLGANGKAVVLDAQTGKEIGVPVIKSTIMPAALSPDRMVFATTDGTPEAEVVHVRDVATSQPRGRAVVDNLGFSKLIFNSSGRFLLAESSDHLTVWDAYGGAPLGSSIKPNGKIVSSADLSSDGSRILSGAGNEVEMWGALPQQVPIPDWLPDLAEAVSGARLDDTGTLIPVPPDQLPSLQARLANASGTDYWTRVGRWYFSPSSRRTISPQSDLMPADLQAKQMHTPSSSQLGVVNSSSALASNSTGPITSDEGKSAVPTTSNETVSVAPVPSSENLRIPAIPSESPGSGKRDATDEVSQAVTLLASKNPKAALAHLARAQRLDPSNFGATTLLFTALMSQQGGPFPLALPVYLPSPVKSVSYSSAGTRFATVYTSVKGDSFVQVWDARTSAPLGNRIEESGAVEAATFSCDDSLLATYGRTIPPHLWETATGLPIGQTLVKGSEFYLGATQVFFSPENKTVTKIGSQSTLSVWDVRTGNPIVQEMDLSDVGVPHSPYPYLLSANGQHVASKMGNNEILLWDIGKKKSVGRLTAGNVISYFEFSSDGKRLVASSFLGPTRIWDVTSGKQIGSDISMAPGGVFHAHFTPDGSKFVAVGGITVRIFDATTAQPTSPIMYQKNIVTDAVFSPDGAGILTIGSDQVRLWQTSTGLALSDSFSPLGTQNVTQAVFGPNGELLTAVGDVVQAWDFCPSKTPPPVWLSALAEAVAGSRISDAGVLEPVEPKQLNALKDQLSSSTGMDYWSRVGRWYFTDPSNRSISPQSDITLSDYVHCLIDKGTSESIDEAQRAGAQNAAWLAQIAVKRATLNSSDH